VAPLRQAVALNPGSATAQFNLGCVLERAGDDAGAAEAFQAVLQLEPSHAKARQALEKANQRLAAAAEPEPEPVQELRPLGGAEESSEQPAAAPPPTPPPSATPAPPRAKTKARSGSGAKWLIPALAVVVLGGAAAAWFLLFASSPAKTAKKYLTALQTQQYDGLEKICTESSQSSISRLKQTASSVGKLSSFELGETKKQGGEATVNTKLSLELPGMMGGGTTKLDVDTVVCLAKEGMNWKVDVNKTQQEMGKALFSKVFSAAFQQLGNALKQGLPNGPPGSPAMPAH